MKKKSNVSLTNSEYSKIYYFLNCSSNILLSQLKGECLFPHRCPTTLLINKQFVDNHLIILSNQDNSSALDIITKFHQSLIFFLVQFIFWQRKVYQNLIINKLCRRKFNIYKFNIHFSIYNRIINRKKKKLFT